MPSFQLFLAPRVLGGLLDLADRDAKKAPKVLKALAKLRTNPNHPGLRTHPYGDKINGKTVNESYVENKTPGAWRIWWQYQGDSTIQVLDIGPHPD